MRKSELLEKLNKLQKQLDDVTNVVDLMARIEHARQDKIKEKKYLYVLREQGKSDYWLSPFPASVKNVKTIGKIKLEVDDE